MTNQRHVPKSQPSQVEKLLVLITVPTGETEKGTSDVACQSLRIWTQNVEKIPVSS